MHPDAEANLSILWQRIVGGSEGLLDPNRGLDRVHNARELRQDAVTRRVGNPASMLTDEPISLAVRRTSSVR